MCCELVDWWPKVAANSTAQCQTCERTRDLVSGWNRPELHHIVGGHSRYNLWCNVLTACKEAHNWCHRDQAAGKIVCWRVKLHKGEFDPVAIEAFWRRPVSGYLQEEKVVLRCRMSSVLERWRQDLLRHCEEVTSGA